MGRGLEPKKIIDIPNFTSRIIVSENIGIAVTQFREVLRPKLTHPHPMSPPPSLEKKLISHPLYLDSRASDSIGTEGQAEFVGGKFQGASGMPNQKKTGPARIVGVIRSDVLKIRQRMALLRQKGLNL